MLPSKLVFVIPSLDVGGMERVMIEIVNHFSRKNLAEEIHLIILTKKERKFSIHENVVIHEPNFNYQDFSKIRHTLKSIKYLRNKIKYIKPISILSFGDRYNSLVILSSLFIKTDVYVSNRMNPNLSNGLFIDILNKLLYRFASGIIAQTNTAKEIFLKRYANKSVSIIHNPIKIVSPKDVIKENIILNVGRFVDGKNQHLLVEYFKKVNINNNWKLVFLGDGPNLELVKENVSKLGLNDFVEFHGNVDNVDQFYAKSKIFAFTSSSEGFPNVLGEAMSAKVVCISFDCITGPSELIHNKENGFLIPLFNDDDYVSKLEKLMNDEKLIKDFAANAFKKIKCFSIDKICQKYYNLFFQPTNQIN